ncbi:MAG: lysophospholipid acyltransferase family protein [Anaerolineae bacterium]
MSTPSSAACNFKQKLLLWLLRLVMKLLLRLEVTGLEHISPSGPLVIIINHIALLDPIIVCGISPRLVIPLAKKEAFDSPLWGPLLKLYGAISVNRGEADLRAIKSTLQVLQQQGAILMAPEGTRSRTYQLQPAKEGAAMLIWRSGAMVVPVGVTGTPHITGYWRKLRRAPVQLTVGSAFALPASSTKGRPSRAELAAMTQELMLRLAQQLPPEFRGVYSQPEAISAELVISDDVC